MVSWHTRRKMPNTLSTQESKNSKAACRAEPKEHSSMNWENICVCSSWEYSLWLERSRDLRKPEGVRRGSGAGLPWLPQLSDHSPLLPAPQLLALAIQDLWLSRSSQREQFSSSHTTAPWRPFLLSAYTYCCRLGHAPHQSYTEYSARYWAEGSQTVGHIPPCTLTPSKTRIAEEEQAVYPSRSFTVPMEPRPPTTPSLESFGPKLSLFIYPEGRKGCQHLETPQRGPG